jgi:uncharacterized protein
VNTLRVTVAYAVPGLGGVANSSLGVANLGETNIDLPSNSTIADALLAAGFQATEVAAVGIWGKVRPLTFMLRDRDRIEIYRPLQADPKTARRVRGGGTSQEKAKAAN